MRCGKGRLSLRCKHMSRSQPARMRCGKEVHADPAAMRQMSQPARMRCGKGKWRIKIRRTQLSQPARMRCGKVSGFERYSGRQAVATRTNALWQRCTMLFMSRFAASQPARMRCGKGVRCCLCHDLPRRNPHECAVAKRR